MILETGFLWEQWPEQYYEFRLWATFLKYSFASVDNR